MRLHFGVRSRLAPEFVGVLRIWLLLLFWRCCCWLGAGGASWGLKGVYEYASIPPRQRRRAQEQKLDGCSKASQLRRHHGSCWFVAGCKPDEMTGLAAAESISRDVEATLAEKKGGQKNVACDGPTKN